MPNGYAAKFAITALVCRAASMVRTQTSLIRERGHWQDRDRGFDSDAPAGGVVIRR
jgi:hypothetical protein